MFDEGVKTFLMSADGIIYSLRMHGLLRKLEGLNRWTEYEYARSIMLSPDGKLFTIDDVDNLRQIIAPRSSLVLDTDVTSAVMAADGTIYTYVGTRELHRLLPGARSPTVLDTGVQFYHLAPNGTLFELNDLGQLRSLRDRTSWTKLDSV